MDWNQILSETTIDMPEQSVWTLLPSCEHSNQVCETLVIITPREEGKRIKTLRNRKGESYFFNLFI